MADTGGNPVKSWRLPSSYTISISSIAQAGSGFAFAGTSIDCPMHCANNMIGGVFDSAGNCLYGTILPGGVYNYEPTYGCYGDCIIPTYDSSIAFLVNDGFYSSPLLIKLDHNHSSCLTLSSGFLLNIGSCVSSDTAITETSGGVIDSGGVVNKGIADSIICKVVGVKNINVQNNAINIYPNPAHNKFTIDIKDAVNNSYCIRLYTITGICLKSVILTRNKTVIGISGLISGIYYIYIQNTVTGYTSVKKLIVQ